MQRSWIVVRLVAMVLSAGACTPTGSPDPIDRSPRVAPAGSAEGLDTVEDAGAPVAPASWRGEVERRIAHGEQAIREEDGFRGANRAHGFVVRFDAAGAARVSQREGDAEVSLRFAGVGREEAVAPRSVSLGACRSDGAMDERGECLRRLEVERDGVLEWWENRDEGLEQGFVVHERPAGGLSVRVAVEGARVEIVSGSEAALVLADGTRLAYRGLRAWDAGGRELDARMTRADAGTLVLSVDDEGARYPVTIDPVLATSAAWTAESNQAAAQFGVSVSSAGDVNGDGFGDVIVGAWGFDNGQTDEGRAYLYLGSASGLGASAAWIAESNQAEAHFGQSVSSAGDVNGDGFGDVIVGAPSFDNGQTDEGRAFVFLGSASGLGTSAAWTAESNQSAAGFGRSVSSAGDVNGDGFGDVIVGAHGFENGETAEGRAYVYVGSASGLGTSAAWTAESDQVGAYFGESVSSAGDVNGDGFGDVIVGAHYFDNGQTNEGRAYVYLGSASGLGTSAAWTAESNQAYGYFGGSVSSAGDVNGDGFGDVTLGAYRFDNGETDEGRAYVYLGSASGLGTSAAWTAESNQAGAWFGSRVSSAGDVNGDGFGDVIVGAWLFDNGQADEGRAYVYLGSASGLGASAAWTAESNQANAYLGYAVSSAGDVNGDGFGDVVVGAFAYDNGQTNEGRAFVYLGGGDRDGDGHETPSVGGDDCDDTDASIHPGASDASCDGVDQDCSGAADDAYVSVPTSCGVGACASSGSTSCAAGAVVDSCTPGTPAATDVSCDGVDDDCDGVSDDDYAPMATTCGNGGCARTGSTSCESGAIVDSCVPGAPAADDATCDEVDDDCDGANNEDYVPVVTTCGAGACASTGITSCPDYVLVDSCSPGTPALTDASCDGVDDDCDGATDEDYAPVTTSCGVGACGATGSTSCVSASVVDSCTAATPAAGDASCDGADDDCDGATDEDYAPVDTTCGVGACASTGSTSCVSGAAVDSCTAGTPAADDASCDGVDDDCDDVLDEDGACGDAGPVRTDGGSSSRDAGASADGSITPPSAGGCGCVAAGTSSPAWPPLLAIPLLLGWMIRRRTRSHRVE